MEPLYTATIECAPGVSALDENVAIPEPFNEAEPKTELPSMKVTVPVGVPTPPLTAAVNISVWPNMVGLTEGFTVVLVLV